jgi:biopolymer transport protein ExbB/TolQ
VDFLVVVFSLVLAITQTNVVIFSSISATLLALKNIWKFVDASRRNNRRVQPNTSSEQKQQIDRDVNQLQGHSVVSSEQENQDQFAPLIQREILD